MAKKRGITEDQINRYEESVTGSLLYTIFVMGRMQSGNQDMLTEEGKIFLDEQLEIRRLAMDGPAIFLGHCASEALEDIRKGSSRYSSAPAMTRR